jgi:hypothetical protein
MARRKKRRFGSPPAEHRERATKWTKAARLAARDVIRALKKDQCRTALRSLEEVNRFTARAASERHGAGIKVRYVGRTVNSLARKFANKCLK